MSDAPRPAPAPGVRDRPVVVLERGDSLDQALREFRKRCGHAGIRGELKRHAAAMSKGVRRRHKARLARARSRRRARRTAREVQDD